MKHTFYPQHLFPQEEGDVEAFIRKDLKKRPDLRVLVEAFLQRVREAESFQPFFDDETIEFLSGDGIYEMRIPKTRSGGVVRIYFCMHPESAVTLVLLDAELKKDKSGSVKSRSVSRMKTFLEDLAKVKANANKPKR